VNAHQLLYYSATNAALYFMLNISYWLTCQSFNTFQNKAPVYGGVPIQLKTLVDCSFPCTNYEYNQLAIAATTHPKKNKQAFGY